MPLSFDISAQSNAPVPPAQPAPGVSVAPRGGGGGGVSEQALADTIGAVVTGGTFDGLSLSYNGVTREISGVNTDKGSLARAAHEAAADPHPQYTTDAEVAAEIAAHEADSDPHPQYVRQSSGEVAENLNFTGNVSFRGNLTTQKVGPVHFMSPGFVDTDKVALRLTPDDKATAPAGQTTELVITSRKPSGAGAHDWVLGLVRDPGYTDGRLLIELPVLRQTDAQERFTMSPGATFSLSRLDPWDAASAATFGYSGPLPMPGLSGQLHYSDSHLNFYSPDSGQWRRVPHFPKPVSMAVGDVPTWDGTQWVVAPGGGGGGGGGGTSDHGALLGLADDDHPQYHTNARGDARYFRLGANNNDPTGRIGLGSLATFSKLEITGTAGDASIYLQRVQDNNVGPDFYFAKQRTADNLTPLVNEDILGRYIFQGSDGTGMVSSALWQVRAASNWSVSNRHSTFRFAPVSSGSTAASLAFEINGDYIDARRELRLNGSPGTSGQFLRSNGAGNLPTWANVPDPWTYIVKATDQSWSDNVNYTTLSELIFSAPSAGTWLLEMRLLYATGHVNSVLRTAFRYRTGSPTQLAAGRINVGAAVMIQRSTDGTNQSTDVYSAAGTATATYANLATGEWMVKSSGASGVNDLWVVFGPELASTQVTILAGSFLRYRKIA